MFSPCQPQLLLSKSQLLLVQAAPAPAAAAAAAHLAVLVLLLLLMWMPLLLHHHPTRLLKLAAHPIPQQHRDHTAGVCWGRIHWSRMDPAAGDGSNSNQMKLQCLSSK
jgi:hypothetical protein